MSEVLDHLDIQADKDKVSVGIKVGNVHDPVPSSPDFGIGDAIEDWENAIDISSMVEGTNLAPPPLRLHANTTALGAVGKYAEGDYCLKDFKG